MIIIVIIIIIIIIINITFNKNQLQKNLDVLIKITGSHWNLFFLLYRLFLFYNQFCHYNVLRWLNRIYKRSANMSAML